MSNTDEKVSKILQPLAKDIASCLQDTTGNKIGFSLVVFSDSADGRMQYISNCKRQEVAEALQTLINGWQQGMQDIPAHLIN